MKYVITSVSVEMKKLFHSKVPYITFIFMLLIPFFCGFFMFILKNPTTAEKLGFITSKAQLTTGGTADWISYISLLTQAISIGGIIVFGFITSWVFGREYSDRTIKDLLALPIPREVIVYAKFIVISILCIILSIIVYLVGITVGFSLGLEGYTGIVMKQGSLNFFICSILTIILSTPVGLIASIGRGYLSPIAFLILMIFLSQIIAMTGYGIYFPWAIPALLSGVSGEISFLLSSYILVIITGLVGIVSTSLWWQYKDIK